MSTRRLSSFVCAAAVIAASVPVVGLASAAGAVTKYCASVTPVSQRPALHHGDDGWCVQELQSRLTKNGYAVKETHGFDQTTLGVLKKFQTKKKLPVTGVVDSKTWTTLIGGALEISPYESDTQYIQQRGPNRTSRIVLSFDDCPTSHTSFKAAVDAASALKVTLVLAPTGECQKGKTFSTEYARSKGQIVIGHSQTHPNLRNLSDADVLKQIDAASSESHYLRPPFGSWDERVTKLLKDKGVGVWAWTRDSGDWSGLSQKDIVTYITDTAQPNDTILLHMGWNAFNPSALGQIKGGLAKRRLSLCQAYVGKTAPKSLPDNLPCEPVTASS